MAGIRSTQGVCAALAATLLIILLLAHGARPATEAHAPTAAAAAVGICDASSWPEESAGHFWIRDHQESVAQADVALEGV